VLVVVVAFTISKGLLVVDAPAQAPAKIVVVVVDAPAQAPAKIVVVAVARRPNNNAFPLL